MTPARGAVTALATALAVVILWRVHDAVYLLLTSLVITSAVSLVVQALRRRGLPRIPALLLAYLAGLTLAGGLLFIVCRAILVDAPRHADHFAAAFDALKARAPSMGGMSRRLLEALPASTTVFRGIGEVRSSELASGALDATRRLVDGVIFSVFSLVLSVYWTGRGVHVERLISTLIGEARCDRLFGVGRALGRLAGQHVHRALVESTLCAVTLALTLELLGDDAWAFPAAAAAMSLRVPFVGPLLAVLLVTCTGLATSPLFALVSAAITLAIVVVLRAWVAPRWLQVRRANPLVEIATAMVLASALGVAGLILTPLAATLASSIGRRLLAMHVVGRVGTDDLALLAADVALLGHAVQQADATVPEDVRDLVVRLRSLVGEGEASLAAQGSLVRTSSPKPPTTP